jgi:hypothetical protein
LFVGTRLEKKTGGLNEVKEVHPNSIRVQIELGIKGKSHSNLE